MQTFEAGSAIVVGVPLPPSYHADARLITTVEDWARKPNVLSFYAATDDVCLGREKILRFARDMIQPESKYILFVDSDVIPRKNTLDRLLSHDVDIVSGVVPIVQNGKVVWNVSREEDGKSFRGLDICELPDNPFKANSFGFGIVLVKTDVFRKLSWPYFGHQNEFAHRKIGEDINFCYEVKKAGFDLWVDPMVKCDHARTVSLGSLANQKLKGNT